jgi:hypothetical protein
MKFFHDSFAPFKSLGRPFLEEETVLKIIHIPPSLLLFAEKSRRPKQKPSKTQRDQFEILS